MSGLEHYQVTENEKQKEIDEYGIEIYKYKTIVRLLDDIKANKSLIQFKLLGDEFDIYVEKINNNYDSMLDKLENEYNSNQTNITMQYDQHILQSENSLLQLKAANKTKEHRKDVNNILTHGSTRGDTSIMGTTFDMAGSVLGGVGEGWSKSKISNGISNAKRDKANTLAKLLDDANTQADNLNKMRESEIILEYKRVFSKGKSIYHENRVEIIECLEVFFNDINQNGDSVQKVSDFLNFITYRIDIPLSENIFSLNDISTILNNTSITDDLKYIENKSIESYNKSKAHYEDLIKLFTQLGNKKDIVLNLNNEINDELDVLKKYFEIDFNDIDNSSKHIYENLNDLNRLLLKNKTETLSRFEKIINDYDLLQESKDLITEITFHYSEILKTFEVMEKYAILPHYNNIMENSSLPEGFKTFIEEKFSVIDIKTLNSFYDNNYYTDNIKKEFKDFIDKNNNINENINLIENFIESFNKNHDVLTQKLEAQFKKKMIIYASSAILIIIVIGIIAIFLAPAEMKINYRSNANKVISLHTNPSLIKHIEKPSKSVQLAAVNKDGELIRYIRNPSEAVQLAAVKQKGTALQYIKDPSEAVQLAAEKQKGTALQ